jgi:glutathione S-transferase
VITVHHLEKSRSHRVLWMLEELGLPYEIVEYKRNPKTLLAPPELQKIHPLGKSPVLDEDGTIYAESAAILEHLVEKHGGGRFTPAAGTPEHVRYRYFMHYAEGSVMSPLLLKLVTSRLRAAKLPFFIKPIAKKIAGTIDASFTDPNLRRHLEFIDAELGKSPYFCGEEFSVADVQMSYPVSGLLLRANDLGPTASCKAFYERIRERPAYKRAVDRGGPPM